MLYLFLSVSSSKLLPSLCADKEKVDEKLICFAQQQQSIINSIKNPYLTCQFNCQQYSGKVKEQCTHRCEQLDYSSKNSEECLLKCSNVLDPLNQQQCISSCRRYKRLDYSSDFTDSCQRCEDLISFIRDWYHKYTASEVSEGFKMACTTTSQLFPICQAIGASGFDSFMQLLLSSSSDQEICHKMHLCSY